MYVELFKQLREHHPMPPAPDRDQLAARFAARLRSLRAANGMSQEALAGAAGIHRTHVGFLERGERLPGLEVLVQLAHALGIPVTDLVADLDQPL